MNNKNQNHNHNKIRDEGLVPHAKHRYRIDIINDDTYEDVTTIHITRFNAIFFSMVFFVLINLLIISAIVFTPIRYYIPGYGGVSSRKELIILKMQYDSLENSLRQHDIYFKALKDVLAGNAFLNETTTYPNIQKK